MAIVPTPCYHDIVVQDTHQPQTWTWSHDFSADGCPRIVVQVRPWSIARAATLSLTVEHNGVVAGQDSATRRDMEMMNIPIEGPGAVSVTITLSGGSSSFNAWAQAY